LLGVPRRRTLAAGDSCNDLDMLSAARAIVVGNATPELRAALRGTDTYLAEDTHAAGVLEGLRELGVPLPSEEEVLVS
jgi:hydroxymethylpyrimidine pyrophosphatase-like HAD family hydrolase